MSILAICRRQLFALNEIQFDTNQERLMLPYIRIRIVCKQCLLKSVIFQGIRDTPANYNGKQML